MDTAAGDADAFHALYSAFVPRVYGYLRLRMADLSEIQDLMQVIFLAVWRNAGSYAGTSTVAAWIFGIARNKLLDWVRGREKFARLETWPASSEEGGDLADPDFADLVVAQLSIAHALATLPPHYAELFYLVFVESLSYKEISTLLEIHEGTLKSRMHQAKRRLRQQLAEGGVQGG